MAHQAALVALLKTKVNNASLLAQKSRQNYPGGFGELLRILCVQCFPAVGNFGDIFASQSV